MDLARRRSFDCSQQGPSQWQLGLQPGAGYGIQGFDTLGSWEGIEQGTCIEDLAINWKYIRIYSRTAWLPH